MMETYKTPEKSLEMRLLKIMGHLFMIGFVFFVLLPLFWMVLTAFKKEGQAFKMDFFPKTEKSIQDLQLADIMHENSGGFFFYADPSAQHVSIAGSFNGWSKKTHTLKQIAGGWYIYLPDMNDGTYEYKFVVNRTKWIQDKDNPNEENGNSLAVIQNGQTFFNTRPQLLASPGKEGIKISFEKPGVQGFSIQLNDQLITGKKAEGGWALSIPASAVNEKPVFQYKVPFSVALSDLYTLENFSEILTNKDFPFARFFKNSLIVATLCGLLTVIICTFAGYAFAVKEFPYRDAIFNMLMLSMMIPGMIYMVPQFAMIVKMNLINSYTGMIIPHLANVFGLLLLRQYIQTIPRDLFQAAKIDGANELQVMLKIVVPLSLPIMVTLFLLVFVGQWSNFLWQLIVNTPDSLKITLPVGLQFFKGQYGAKWEAMMAGACFSILPTAILFLFAQKYFIEGLTQGAVKG